MREVVVVGAGGFGREVLDVIEAHNAAGADRIEVAGVVDDAPSERNLERLAARGYRLLGGVSDVIRSFPDVGYVIGVGSPAARRSLAATLDAAGWHAVTVVHPTVTVGSASVLGEGSVICAGVQVSTNVSLGRHVHLNPHATIGHDAALGDFTSVNPGAIISGEVVIEPGVLIGAGAVVIQGLTVGSQAIVGASACVTRSVGGGETVVGVPARVHVRSDR